MLSKNTLSQNKNYTMTFYNNIEYFSIVMTDNISCNQDIWHLFETTCDEIFKKIKDKKSVLVCDIDTNLNKINNDNAYIIISAFLVKYLELDYAQATTFVDLKSKHCTNKQSCLSQELFNYYMKLNGTKQN
jgi:hypothetical protein